MVLEHTPVKASQNRMVWSYPAEANMTDIEEVVVYWMRGFVNERSIFGQSNKE